MNGLSRRDALRKAGVAGAVVWTAPVVLGHVSPAHAAGTPPPTDPTCQCEGYAFGLDVDGTLYSESPPDDPCVPTVSDRGVTATAVCSSASSQCHASASVASVTIVTDTTPSHTVTATDITASSQCGCCSSSATSSVGSLTIDGDPKTAGSGFAQYSLGQEGTVYLNTENLQCANDRLGGLLRVALWVIPAGADPEQVRVAYASTRCAPIPTGSCC